MSRSDLAALAQPEAERLAREMLAIEMVLGSHPRGVPWEALSFVSRNAYTTAFVALLTDLSRPASRDWWARWLAERVGLTCGATAPAWGLYVCGEHCEDGETGRMVRCRRPIWSLMAADGLDPVTFAECGLEVPDDREIVPGISSVTDASEALRLAVLAVAGGSR